MIGEYDALLSDFLEACIVAKAGDKDSVIWMGRTYNFKRTFDPEKGLVLKEFHSMQMPLVKKYNKQLLWPTTKQLEPVADAIYFKNRKECTSPSKLIKLLKGMLYIDVEQYVADHFEGITGPRKITVVGDNAVVVSDSQNVNLSIGDRQPSLPLADIHPCRGMSYEQIVAFVAGIGCDPVGMEALVKYLHATSGLGQTQAAVAATGKRKDRGDVGMDPSTTAVHGAATGQGRFGDGIARPPSATSAAFARPPPSPSPPFPGVARPHLATTARFGHHPPSPATNPFSGASSSFAAGGGMRPPAASGGSGSAPSSPFTNVSGGPSPSPFAGRQFGLGTGGYAPAAWAGTPTGPSGPLASTTFAGAGAFPSSSASSGSIPMNTNTKSGGPHYNSSGAGTAGSSNSNGGGRDYNFAAASTATGAAAGTAFQQRTAAPGKKFKANPVNSNDDVDKDDH